MFALKRGLLGSAALVLTTVTSPARADIPDGSYRDTCTHIRVHGDTLVADCQRRDGSWGRTAMNLDRCRSGIDNWNGHLSCSRRADRWDDNARRYEEDRRYSR